MTVEYKSMARQKAEDSMASMPACDPDKKPDVWASVKTKQFFQSSDGVQCYCHLCGKPRVDRESSTKYRKNGSRKRMIFIDRYACGTKIVIDSKKDTEVLFGSECIKPNVG